MVRKNRRYRGAGSVKNEIPEKATPRQKIGSATRVSRNPCGEGLKKRYKLYPRIMSTAEPASSGRLIALMEVATEMMLLPNA